MEGGDLSCVCVSELRTRSVCSVECVTRGMCGVCACAQWPGRAGAGRRAFTPGHVLPCAAFSAPRAVLSVLTVEFVVECCLLSLLQVCCRVCCLSLSAVVSYTGNPYMPCCIPCKCLYT